LFQLIELWLPTSLPQELDLSLRVLDLPWALLLPLSLLLLQEQDQDHCREKIHLQSAAAE
jgi:hypothetical protein